MVNFNELKDIARNNLEFMKEMIDLFLEKNPQDISELETAFSSGDFRSLKAIAHRMKTSVGFMGLRVLSKPLNELEELAEQERDIQKIQQLLEQVKKDCLLAIQEFKNFLISNS